MARKVFLTTEDNPYNPATQFDLWYNFDTIKGYNTCSYLARMANTSNGNTDKENERIVEAAINDIVALNLTGNYKKLVIEG